MSGACLLAMVVHRRRHASPQPASRMRTMMIVTAEAATMGNKLSACDAFFTPVSGSMGKCQAVARTSAGLTCGGRGRHRLVGATGSPSCALCAQCDVGRLGPLKRNLRVFLWSLRCILTLITARGLTDLCIATTLTGAHTTTIPNGTELSTRRSVDVHDRAARCEQCTTRRIIGKSIGSWYTRCWRT